MKPPEPTCLPRIDRACSKYQSYTVIRFLYNRKGFWNTRTPGLLKHFKFNRILLKMVEKYQYENSRKCLQIFQCFGHLKFIGNGRRVCFHSFKFLKLNHFGAKLQLWGVKFKKFVLWNIDAFKSIWKFKPIYDQRFLYVTIRLCMKWKAAV